MSISEKNPKLAKLAGQFIKFYAFSMLVTLLQYLLLTFLPGCSTPTPTGAASPASSST